jgi:type IV pilus assembly protein PilO
MALSMDSILKLPTRKKILLLIVILAVIAGLFTYMVFSPQKEELDRLKVELNKLTKELNEAKAITRDLPKFKEQAALLEKQLAEAMTQLPNEKEIPEILKKISSLGKESRLEFTLFRPKPEQPKQFYATVPIELVALGNYHDVGMFFDRVSKLQRIINVVDFNMTRAKDVKGRAETENLIRASCLMNTYRFIERGPEEKKGEKTSGTK